MSSNALVSSLHRRLDAVTDIAYELLSEVKAPASLKGTSRLLYLSNELRLHGSQRVHSHSPGVSCNVDDQPR